MQCPIMIRSAFARCALYPQYSMSVGAEGSRMEIRVRLVA